MQYWEATKKQELTEGRDKNTHTTPISAQISLTSMYARRYTCLYIGRVGKLLEVNYLLKLSPKLKLHN